MKLVVECTAGVSYNSVESERGVIRMSGVSGVAGRGVGSTRAAKRICCSVCTLVSTASSRDADCDSMA